MWHFNNYFFSIGKIGPFLYILVTDEETDVTELLWVVVIVDVDIWDIFCETLVTLSVDLKVVEVIFVETSGVIILDVAMRFEVVAVPLFETEATRIVDGFAVFKVVAVPLFETEAAAVVDGFAMGFEVVAIIFETGETGVFDGFTLKLEDSLVWLKSTCGAARI